jgi:alkylation response protein AidB-like acyl-CoA dehydrogenase
LFFRAQDCEILDTWDSIGLRGTASHDYAVADLFVPMTHSLSFLEQPIEPGPLYAFPTIALFATVLAAVPLGIARHAIDILTSLAGTKIATRSMKTLREDVVIQADLGRAEALVRSARSFLYETLREAWQSATEGHPLTSDSERRCGLPARLHRTRRHCARRLSRQRHAVIAAARTGRRCYGLELDPGYVDTIIRRWQALTGGPARHAASGRSFDDLAGEAEAGDAA